MLLGARQKAGLTGPVAGLLTALTALIGVLCPLPAQSAGLGQASRIASVNLCADQLLLALAPASRIAALGPFARDPAVSFLANRAKEFPQLSGRSEELVMVRADAFMVGPFDNKHMRSMLDRRGAPVLVVNRWGVVADVIRGIDEVAAAIGEANAGRALVAEIHRALQKLRDLASTHDTARSFLVVHRRGYIDDGGLLSELLAVAGLRDASRGAPARFADVETIISLRPDFLVVADADAPAEDRGLELLQHPALRRLYPRDRRISAPDRLTICGGPSTPVLIDRLGEQLKGLLQGR